MTTNRIRRALLASAALALASGLGLQAGAASAAGWSKVRGSGRVVKVQRSVGGFSAVSLELPATVDLIQGRIEGLTIETDDNLVDLIDTVVERGVLRLRFKDRQVSVDSQGIRISLQARALEALSIGGSGTLRASQWAGPKLGCALAGSGRFSFERLDTDSLVLSLSGSGDFEAAGRADSLEVRMAGSGDLRVPGLSARKAVLAMAGSGDATVWARDSLTVNAAGSGDVAYYGDPVLVQSVLGSGTVRRLGAAP